MIAAGVQWRSSYARRCNPAGDDADGVHARRQDPQDHPIRVIRPIVDRALLELSPVFNAMYAKVGRPSIPPEHLLKAQLLMALFSVPSARRFCEQLEYNLLFKWFLDRNVDDPAFDASTFSKNQERLLQHDTARQFLAAVTAEAQRRQIPLQRPLHGRRHAAAGVGVAQERAAAR